MVGCSGGDVEMIMMKRRMEPVKGYILTDFPSFKDLWEVKCTKTSRDRVLIGADPTYKLTQTYNTN